MSTTPSIPKNPSLLPDQDYNSLREQGRQYLESMATAIWTDFNEHDPGITFLEVLCYAITELGYRTSFPIQNLLMQPNGTMLPGQCFFTPKQILTVNPLTIRDYRKLLVDLDGVQNAWLEPRSAIVGQEVAFYADCDKDQLSIDDGSQPVPPDHEIHLSGLYRVMVDLESDPSLGDLNNTNITFRIAEGSFQDQVVTFCFGGLEALDPVTYREVLNAVVSSAYAAVIGGLTVSRTNSQYHWDGQLTVNLPAQTSPPAPARTIIIPLVVRIDSLFQRNDIASATTYLNTVLFSNIDQLHSIMVQYQQKVNLIADNLLNIRRTLLEHRNLCEDFRQVVTVMDQEVALCMDIDIATGADINDIQAQIFFQVQSYFSPSVNFYSLKNLMAQGVPVDQIFEGPVLTHGFINNTELDQTNLLSIVRTSDLVKIIMGIEGVLAVRNVMMTLYDVNGEPILPSETACVLIPAGYKALLNLDRSKLTFYVGKIPLRADMTDTLDIIRYLQAVQAQNKLYGTEDDLAVPLGTYSDLEDYYSVQNDLPQTYGVGVAGLASSAPPARQAQALQLKGYLMFFDQLLANFFSQLKGAGRLLSTDPTLVQSYFTQYLGPSAPPFYQDGVKNIDSLYIDTDTGLIGTGSVSSLLGGSEIGSIDWQKLVESEQTFSARRNAFLDHLLSRFAESFGDYALMMYQVNFDLQQTETQSDPAMISAKINFLNQYPSISMNRGRAINYCPLLINPTTLLPVLDPISGLPSVDTGLDPSDPPNGGLWDACNMSGLEKRASLLSGISLPQGIRYNQYLYSPSMGEVVAVNPGGLAPFYYAFYNAQGHALLTSIKQTYGSQLAAQTDMALVSSHLALAAYYYVQPQGDGTFKLFITDNTVQPGNLLATDGVSYSTEADATAAMAALVQFFTNANATGYNNIGFYLLEHILLRPRQVTAPSSNFELMEVCLGKECHFCGEQDPYTFRASVVLPYWVAEFENLDFRAYFENTIMAEAPAHLSLKICWVNNGSMRQFETAYRTWLNALSVYTTNPGDPTLTDALRVANDALITIIQNFHSEYPLAVLHDCDESQTDNVVILGSTVLGTYKN